jgi:hypothetical protein
MEIKSHNIKQHVTILGWLHIANSALGIVIGAFILVFFLVLGPATRDPEAVLILSIVGTLTCGFLLLFSLPGVLAGIGLLKGQNWGRILALIVGLFNLINVPVGTVLAGYTFWVLLQNEANAYFEPQPA